MSFDDRNSSLDASNGPPITEIVDVGFDVRLLGSIVAESEEIHTDDSELLTRLESADTVASGVEARLDEILGTLDDLLIRLEPKDDELHQVGIQRSESQPDHPPLSNHELFDAVYYIEHASTHKLKFTTAGANVSVAGNYIHQGYST